MSIKGGIKGLTKYVKDLESFGNRKAKFALENTINQIAREIQKKEVAEMQDSFDRPTPHVLRSVRYEQASVKAKSLQATVFINKDYGKGIPQNKVLRAEINGGIRRMKRFEIALQRIGVMPQGWIAVPGQAAPLDRYGNISPGEIVRILSWFGAFPEVGYRMNATALTKAKKAKGTKKRPGSYYLADALNDGVLGIFKVTGNNIDPILIFKRKALYGKNFLFRETGELVMRRQAAAIFRRNLAAYVTNAGGSVS